MKKIQIVLTLRVFVTTMTRQIAIRMVDCIHGRQQWIQQENFPQMAPIADLVRPVRQLILFVAYALKAGIFRRRLISIRCLLKLMLVNIMLS